MTPPRENTGHFQVSFSPPLSSARAMAERGRHGGRGKGQALAVRGQAEEEVPGGEPAYAADDGAHDQQGDGPQPVAVQEGARRQGGRLGMGHVPVRQQLGDAELLGLGGAHEVLAEEQVEEGPLLPGHQGRGHVHQQVDLLAAQGGEGPLGHLQEEDHRHPLGRGADAPAGDQAQVHLPRGHDQGDEDDADDGAHGEAALELLAGLQQGAVLLHLLPLAPAQPLAQALLSVLGHGLRSWPPLLSWPQPPSALSRSGRGRPWTPCRGYAR